MTKALSARSMALRDASSLTGLGADLGLDCRQPGWQGRELGDVPVGTIE